ncbi:acetylcholine receptor subunit alpha-type acr-16-like [Aplysia californica]|uniref:Acetylcholine receptor subunit alpha-type acr-16-like n=1 Tax=Aplysia californica TaxID=6500 RepID=A0ABM1VR08_APLCA|nr:acetylcholine receptor subunit alpha-type acr-16-like [Aplysia californica]
MNEERAHTVSGGAQDMKRLLDTVFANYSVHVRPAVSYGHPTQVKFQMFPNAVLSLAWVDELLRWSPADYGEIEDFLVPQADVWKPDIAFGRSRLEEDAYFGSERSNVEVASTGLVRWEPSFNYKLMCEVLLEGLPMNMSLMISNGEFEVAYEKFEVKTYTYSYTKDTYDALAYYLKITRRPAYKGMRSLPPPPPHPHLSPVSLTLPAGTRKPGQVPGGRLAPALLHRVPGSIGR